MVLEKTLESPLDLKKIKSVNPKGNQHLIFIGMTAAEVCSLASKMTLVPLMLKLKLQHFGHLMQRGDLLEKTRMLEKIEGGRTWG